MMKGVPQPIVIGIDPAVGKGESRIAVAVLSADGSSFMQAHCFRVGDKVSMPYAVESLSQVLGLANPREAVCQVLVVEGQTVYPAGSVRTQRVSPQSIVHLSQMAGALLGMGSLIFRPKRILMPSPSDVSKLNKETRHLQVLTKMDCKLEYVAERTTHWHVHRAHSRPVIEDQPPLSKFPLDVLDAVCLARYGCKSKASDEQIEL